MRPRLPPPGLHGVRSRSPHLAQGGHESGAGRGDPGRLRGIAPHLMGFYGILWDFMVI